MPNLKLPFPAGESWTLTRGYNTVTHKYYGPWADDRYALDFVENGCLSWGKPILAAADGVIEIKSLTNTGGYGINLFINHGNGYKSRYAHLDSILVEDGAHVQQGDEIGLIGNTGNVSGSACPAHGGMHLHFALYKNGVGIKAEPMSGYTNFVAPKQYTSDNTTSAGSYEYNKNMYTCTGPIVGGGHTDWMYACYDAGKVFQVGEMIYAFVRIENVTSDHRFRVETYKNNAFQWEWTAGWNEVGSDGWTYSHFWPALWGAGAGTWKFKIYVDTGGGFKLLDTTSFEMK